MNAGSLPGASGTLAQASIVMLLPPIFRLLRREGRVPEDDMRQAFNLGVGLVAVVGGEPDGGFPIGEIVDGDGTVRWDG